MRLKPQLICTDQVVERTRICNDDVGSPLHEVDRSMFKIRNLCLMGIANYHHCDPGDRRENRENQLCNSGNYIISIPYFADWIEDDFIK